MGRAVDRLPLPVRAGFDAESRRDAHSLIRRAVLSGWASESELSWIVEDASDPLETVLAVLERHGRLRDAENHLAMCERIRNNCSARTVTL